MIRLRLVALMLFGTLVTTVWLTVGLYSHDEPTTERSQSHRASPAVTQLASAAELQITLGLKDAQQESWQGEVKVTGGRLIALEVVRAARNANVEGARFTVRAARQSRGKQRALAAPQLRATLDAPLSATVEVATSRGSFSFTLSQLSPGQPQQFLDENASVSREEGATRLTGRDTEDDFPALAKSPDGTIWLAYVEYQPGPPLIDERVLAGNFEALEPSGNGDRLRLVRFDGRKWHPALDVTEPRLDLWRPTITVDGQGRVWLMWAQKVEEDWEIKSRRYTPADKAGGTDEWSPVTRVTNAQGSDFHAVAATDATGKVWLAWQGWRKDNYEILVASVDSVIQWSEPLIISRTLANDWGPAISADAKGNVYVAWDTYERGNYDVQLVHFDTKRPAHRTLINVADSPQFEARASIVCDSADRLWIAYEQGDEQWGKDYLSENNFQNVGFDRNPGFALYVNRTLNLKCLVDGVLKEPEGTLEKAFEVTLRRNKSLPRLAVDSAGGIWLLLRHHPQSNGNGETWDSFALRYNGRHWNEPRHLTNSSNLLDNRPAIVPHAEKVLVVYSGDDRTRSQDRQQDDLFSTLLTPSGETYSPQLVDERPASRSTVSPVHTGEIQDVARLREYRLHYGGKQLRPLRGEFHRHTEYTSHRDQDGLLEDAWRYALDAGRLDWMGDGDHDNGFGHEYLWWQIQKICDLHHNPPHMVAAMTYERSLQYPNGHRNVIMPRRGIRPLPRGSLESSPERGTVDTKILYAYLKHFGGICASHTSGTNMGTDWRDNDPEVEPVVEIYQGHRHNYEHLGAPRSATAQTQIGGYRPDGYVWNALEKGYRLGFQSSSDHVSTHMSYAIVLAEDASRQAIIDAFKRRHCYAATDNILLVVRSDQQLMGDAFTTHQRPRLSIEVQGTAPIAKLHVVRDNKYVYTAEPNERAVHRTFTDNEARPGQSSYYYVRVEQSDGNLAWASPMWIIYQPK